jgi:hypothetical protein
MSSGTIWESENTTPSTRRACFPVVSFERWVSGVDSHPFG